ncbi:thioredoxin family protein [Zunongwangia profunda]|uniref:Thioredoxin family protein n=1 Tax=Zunongwangia profunda TaxID=398743 RepID=A0A3D5J5R9_9FLAO|nr:thioredoxin family protein [Zunongwangia profunda]MAS69380.1 thiol-disulfide isomerase [Zunongwangia sp.]HAJ82341.1 thioredoxin family protein [Zunongwangia profunda]HCV83347.1 thioredoxin family protein [Zunongwangia profunda]|tara:strand:+ start:1785 stop:2222 length:438 start_codon:yes stop_codon:yes gene_type:complete
MKNILLVIICVFSTQFLLAQDWKTDFSEAKEEAAKADKPIILVFQGSDWCAPCIKLDKEIWSTEEFKAYAQKNYVMLQADFPRKKKNELTATQQEKNNKLAEMYNPNGYFPFVVILDKSGKVLGQAGYQKAEVKEYITMLNKFVK